MNWTSKIIKTITAFTFVAALLCGAVAQAATIYVSDNNGGFVWTVDSETGAHTKLITGLGAAWGVAVDSSNLYVAETTTARLGKYNLDGTVVDADMFIAGSSSIGAAMSPTGALIGLDFGAEKLYSFDTETGVGTLLNSTDVGDGWGISVDGDGNIYVANNAKYSVSKFDAEGTLLSTFSLSNSMKPQGVWVSGDSLFVSGSNYVGKYDLSGNLVTGFGTNGVISASSARGLATVGNTLYVTRGVDISTYDATTGDLLNLGFSTNMGGLTFMTTAPTFGGGAGDPVPEPATMTLLGLGLAGMAARRMRRRA